VVRNQRKKEKSHSKKRLRVIAENRGDEESQKSNEVKGEGENMTRQKVDLWGEEIGRKREK
jgi:hypothetical protein